MRFNTFAKYSGQFDTMSKKWNADETSEFLLVVAQQLAEEISDPATRERVTRDAARGDILSLCNLSPAYAELTPADARVVRQVSALFSKRADLDLGVDRRGAALDAFIKAENVCRETNEIFRLWGQGRFQFPPDVERCLHAARIKISRILGDAPQVSELKYRFGPGATTSRKRKDASPVFKLEDGIACSESLLPLAAEILSSCPGLLSWEEGTQEQSVPVEIHDGKLNFVPKNWKTDRSVVVEPSLNTFFQLGVGDYIADRLRRNGIDIRDQSRNQRAARRGSLTGELATLDLSSASDTLAKGLVAHLLPDDWLQLLSYGRTPCITYELKGPGEGITFRLRQEKFSSMGNGFTFPLETLIYYALALGCAEGEEDDVLAYGDDIICPAWVAPRLAKVLHSVGCIINWTKSFWSGPFRESCGCDYVLGFDVRPIYVKDSLQTFDLFELSNGFRSKGFNGLSVLFKRLMAPRLRCYGPEGLGDGHFHVPFFDASSRHALLPRGTDEAGWGGFYFRCWNPKAVSTNYRLRSMRFPIYHAYADGPLEFGVEDVRNDEHLQPRIARGRWDPAVAYGPPDCHIVWAEHGLLSRKRTLRAYPDGGRIHGSLTPRGAPAVFTDGKTGKMKVGLPGQKGWKRALCYSLG